LESEAVFLPVRLRILMLKDDGCPFLSDFQLMPLGKCADKLLVLVGAHVPQLDGTPQAAEVLTIDLP
jgi:hypothetical protein